MANLFDDILNNLDKERTGSSGQGFEYGTHTVVIGLAEAKTDAKGRDVIKVTVMDPNDNDKTAEATLWFHSAGGAKMSVDKVLRLIVHNVDESKKPKVRELGEKIFAAITDFGKARDAALTLINEKLIGKEAYLAVNPSGNYTTSKYGDLWYYPAEPQNNGAKAQKATDVPQAELPEDW